MKTFTLCILSALGALVVFQSTAQVAPVNPQASQPAPLVAYVYKAEALRVIDGDTLEVRIDLGFNVWIKRPIRLLDVHAAEAKDANGPAHTAALRALLPVGTQCLIRTHKDDTDKYGRILGEIWVKKVSVNHEMRKVITTPQGR